MSVKEDYKKVIEANREYAQEEFDKQIIYLGSGALVLTVGFVNDLVDLETAEYILILILSWSSFVLTLLTNLLSHRFAVKVSDLELAGDEDKSDELDLWTSRLNWGSFGLLIIGIILFITFVSINIL